MHEYKLLFLFVSEDFNITSTLELPRPHFTYAPHFPSYECKVANLVTQGANQHNFPVSYLKGIFEGYVIEICKPLLILTSDSLQNIFYVFYLVNSVVGLCVAQLAFLTPPFLGGTAFSESEIDC